MSRKHHTLFNFGPNNRLSWTPLVDWDEPEEWPDHTTPGRWRDAGWMLSGRVLGFYVNGKWDVNLHVRWSPRRKLVRPSPENQKEPE